MILFESQNISAFFTSKRTGFVIKAAIASFITYLSMYAFRKPFTAATYDGYTLWGVDYKILLILSQLVGYTLSKYIGIKYIAELRQTKRTRFLIGLMLTAGGSLFLFGLTPYPFNIFWMFCNGIPLGMIWGVVFSYIEGRKHTELLGAVMASSFIISSGIVKGVGKYFLDVVEISEKWMPLITALSFVPILIIGIYILDRLDLPNEEDIATRTERLPMKRIERKSFFTTFYFGIFMSILLYVGLTIFRDVRDNFAVDFWRELNVSNTPELLIFSEMPIAVFVLLIVASMIWIRNNKIAFYLNIGIILFSGTLLLISTFLFQFQLMSPLYWMVISGFAMYLPYIAYHTMYFERWIAFFKYKSNAGFLMYMADSFGYLGSTIVLLIKNFSMPEVSWVVYFINGSTILGFLIIVLTVFLFIYFRSFEKRYNIS